MVPGLRNWWLDASRWSEKTLGEVGPEPVSKDGKGFLERE